MQQVVKIILSGAAGTMGRVLTEAAANREGFSIVAGIDRQAPSDSAFPVFFDPAECGEIPADVLIDFSSPEGALGALRYAVGRGLPAVVAATGFSDEQLRQLEGFSREIPLFFSANMSLGVNLLRELCRRAARALSADFDMEIVEKHHNKKVDAPSGTALMLAKALAEESTSPMAYTYDRQSRRARREKTEIGISSVRGGTIVGEHEVIFAGQDEILTLKHQAASKTIFATGALNAALFLLSQPAGLYDMGNLLDAEG